MKRPKRVIAVHCPTQELFDEVSSKNSYLHTQHWVTYNKNTVFYPDSNMFAYLNFAKDQGDHIIHASIYLNNFKDELTPLNVTARTVVHCPTKELFLEISTVCDSINFDVNALQQTWELYNNSVSEQGIMVVVGYKHALFGNVEYHFNTSNYDYPIDAQDYLDRLRLTKLDKLIQGSLYSSSHYPYQVLWMALDKEKLVLIRNDRHATNGIKKTKLGTILNQSTTEGLFEITDMELSLKLKENE